MSYSNYRPDNRYYSNDYRPRGNNYRPNNNYYQGKKHSGCRIKFASRSGKEGIFMTGWNKSRQGFMTFVASMAHKGQCEGKSPSGNWIKMVVKVTPGHDRPYLVTGFYYPQSQKMRIPDMKMVANPLAPNGGYWGRSGRPRR